MLFLFYGSGWKPAQYYERLRFAVLDLDGGLVGTSTLAGAQSLPYGLTVVSGSSLASIRHDVDSGIFNAAIVASAGASTALLAAATSSAPYDPTTALTFIWDEGRGGSSLAPLLRAAAAQIGAVAAAECTGALLTTTFSTANVSSLNPVVLVRPVAVTVDNLHPVPFAGMATAASIAVIDLWCDQFTPACVRWLTLPPNAFCPQDHNSRFNKHHAEVV